MSNILIYFTEGMLIGLVVVFIGFLIIIRRSFYIEKRITRFSISSITDKPSSLFDNLSTFYLKIIKKLASMISKSKIVVRISKRYDKYIDKKYDDNTFIVANKVLISIMAVFITMISNIIRLHEIGGLSIILALIIGFYIPDISLLINNKIREKQIENDLFKAVIIMGNAFKSGRSIMQAVRIVSEELDGPVGNEFQKAYIDLNYGLDLDVVFERLSSRINIEETKYMTSSLVILSKTGGNVIQVFRSIEKSFFERKKLNDELKSVTALSNFVFKILVAIPFIIFILIYILNPTYFTPLIATSLGKIILVLIVLLYVLYIIIVKKMIKIRE